MALIGKAGAMGGIGQRRAFAQELLGKIDPPVLQIAIGAGACPAAELAGEGEAVKAAHQAFAPYKTEGLSVVDELIREREEEARPEYDQ